jgi:hypothetical protein
MFLYKRIRLIQIHILLNCIEMHGELSRDVLAQEWDSCGMSPEYLPVQLYSLWLARTKRCIWKNYGNGRGLIDHYKYTNDVLCGMQRRYYPDGTLFQKFHYINGKPVGECCIYKPDGTLLRRFRSFIRGQV